MSPRVSEPGEATQDCPQPTSEHTWAPCQEGRVPASNPHYSSAEGLIKARAEAKDVIDVARFKEDVDGKVSTSFPGFHQEVFRSLARSASSADARGTSADQSG